VKPRGAPFCIAASLHQQTELVEQRAQKVTRCISASLHSALLHQQNRA
jgi:hypothetical protein